jgi:predicted Zn-dependent protease with MMP-like domain
MPRRKPQRKNDFWSGRLSPSLDELEALARVAYDGLPKKFRALTGEIVIAVAEFPDEEALDELGIESPFDLLGLFQGRGVAQKADPYTGEFPNRITLFRRPLLDYWAEHEEPLGGLVAHVLIHEIGHHFGLSDDDIDAIEAQAE